VSSVEQTTDRGRSRVRGRDWWIAASVVMLNALTSAGFSVAALSAALASHDESAQVLAMYAAARSLPLAAAVLWLVRARSVGTLGGLAIVMAVIQGCDAFVGLAQHDLGKTLGPAVLALATFASARALLRA
jgi:hypothetical protein